MRLIIIGLLSVAVDAAREPTTIRIPESDLDVQAVPERTIHTAESEVEEVVHSPRKRQHKDLHAAPATYIEEVVHSPRKRQQQELLAAPATYLELAAKDAKSNWSLINQTSLVDISKASIHGPRASKRPPFMDHEPLSRIRPFLPSLVDISKANFKVVEKPYDDDDDDEVHGDGRDNFNKIRGAFIAAKLYKHEPPYFTRHFWKIHFQPQGKMEEVICGTRQLPSDCLTSMASVDDLFDVLDTDDNDEVFPEEAIRVVEMLTLLSRRKPRTSITDEKGTSVTTNRVSVKPATCRPSADRASCKPKGERNTQIINALTHVFQNQDRVEALDMKNLGEQGDEFAMTPKAMKKMPKDEEFLKVLSHFDLKLPVAITSDGGGELLAYLLDIDEDGTIHLPDFLPCVRALTRMDFQSVEVEIQSESGVRSQTMLSLATLLAVVVLQVTARSR